MLPELKKRWVEALRSGKYKQGRGALRAKIDNVDNYCCIGVLCDLFDPDGWSLTRSYKPYYTWKNSVLMPDLDYQTTLVGIEKRFWLGKLASLNDQGKSFEEIANIVERDL